MKVNKFSNYKSSINYLYGLERAGIKYDLKNIKALLKLLNNPERNFKSLHIAGTNGKGSVSSILNSVLIEKGFKTGLYTSPHLIDFRERILFNGKFIPKKHVLNFVNNHYKDIEKIKPSFFEITTALAFEYFNFKKIDYAVIETGLGGRLDSTNVINPVISVITSIDIDHTEFLGNTIIEITKEKAGIIKKNTPVVIGEVSEVSKRIFKKYSKEKMSELIFSENQYKTKIVKKMEHGFYFNIKNGIYSGKNFLFPVIGDYQLKNIKTAFTSLDVISKKEKINFTDVQIFAGLQNLKLNSNLHGRFELISKAPKIVIDISHNLQGVRNIKSNLKYFHYEKLYIIFGMMTDKKFKECISELAKIRTAKIILTKPDYKRSAEPEDLYKAVGKKKSSFEVKKNVAEAFDYVINNSSQKDLILITGSFFLVSDFLKLPGLKTSIEVTG
ncbi:MAG: folylpolyglutamate synthase/dihydrofolate synthase family protein [Ignavibacteria bacterium]